MKDKETVSPEDKELQLVEWLAQRVTIAEHEKGYVLFALRQCRPANGYYSHQLDRIHDLTHRIAELEKENADRNEYYEDKLERSQKAVNLYYDEWKRCESRLSAANEYLKRNGMDVEF